MFYTVLTQTYSHCWQHTFHLKVEVISSLQQIYYNDIHSSTLSFCFSTHQQYICSLANIAARLTFGCIYSSMALLSMQAMEWPHACTVLSHGISHSRSYVNYPQLWKLGVYNLDSHFEISVAHFKWKKVNDTCSSLSKTNPKNEGGNWFSFDIAINGQANVCGKGTFNHGYWSLLSHSPDFGNLQYLLILSTGVSTTLSFS